MFSKILVPIDFSECSLEALSYAAFLARKFDANIVLLHIWEPPRYLLPESLVQPPGEPTQPLVEFARRQAGAELERLIAELESERCTVEGRLEIGDPTDTIIDLATKERFELIVIGTHGRTGLAHFVLGSVAEKVVRQAVCPVLTIRRRDKIDQ